MSKLVVRLTVATLALVVATGVAFAEHEDGKKKKRKGLFGGFLSSGERRDEPLSRRRDSLRSGDEEPIWFWNRKSRLQQKKLEKMRSARRFIDPEAANPGLGMGNLTYVADKLVPLGGTALKQPRPSGAAEAAVYDALKGQELGVRTLPEIRQVMLDHYSQNGFRPIWTGSGRLSERGAAVLKVLAAADEEGLQSSHYLPPSLSGFAAAANITPGDYELLAKLELGLTAMALKYAREASGGQFDPRRLSRYNDITPQYASASEMMKTFVWSTFPDGTLRDVHPKHPAYAALKAKLAELRANAGATRVTPIATGNKVKVGQADERLIAVRARLEVLGTPVEIADDDEPALLNLSDASALKGFQKSAGLKTSGILDNATVNALNGDDPERDLRRVAINMERMRWLPKKLGLRHVFVNQASFQVRVMDGKSVTWRSKVIIGKPDTQTVAFHDEIETVVFNPTWGVPPSIIAGEYLPKLWRDPGYLDRIGFEVTTLNGKRVPSRAINWDAYSYKVPYNIVQPPGGDNALGEIKFLFPNTHNIYMHDTPNRELFADELRIFSHGCVRVENPREYAEVLLGWDRSKVDEFTDSGKHQTIRVGTKIPIHITYFTAWPDDSGKVQFHNDFYGRDAAMEKALTAIMVAQK